jgi:CHAD domain-containing protein
MSAQRTSIRRRLAIGRTANRPPSGARKAGHRSILAPLAGTVAATVAVGVGVAMARAERKRHSRRRRRNARRLGLRGSEALTEALQRMALGQVDRAIELLSRDAAENAVHESRKALKRLRALLRLLDGVLPEDGLARDDALLRDCARRLSQTRDAEVRLSTLELLIECHPRKLDGRGMKRLRRRLRSEQRRSASHSASQRRLRAKALADLYAFRASAAAWQLPEHGGLELFEAQLRRVYRDGRRRYSRAARGKGERTRTLHDWRKRVKDLRYALEMLERHPPAGDRARALRRLAGRADELGEMLGEEHDLAMLSAWIASSGKRGGRHGDKVPRPTRRALQKLIERRRKALRRQALREGARLYKRPPKRFIKDIRAATDAARLS